MKTYKLSDIEMDKCLRQFGYTGYMNECLNVLQWYAYNEDFIAEYNFNGNIINSNIINPTV